MKNCEQIQVWFEQGKSESINPAKRLKMRFHLMMCKCCKGYTLDSNKLDKALSKSTIVDAKCTKAELEKIRNAVK